MEQRIFMDRQNKPIEQFLKDALGIVFEEYKRINEITSDFKKDWTFTKSSGWMQKVFDNRKALFYLIPMKNKFKISMAIREEERDLFLKDECFNLYNEKLLSSKKYIEGYAIQFLIAKHEDYTDFEVFIKMLMKIRR